MRQYEIVALRLPWNCGVASVGSNEIELGWQFFDGGWPVRDRCVFGNAVGVVVAAFAVMAGTTTLRANEFPVAVESRNETIKLSANRLASPDGTRIDLATAVSETRLTVVCFLGTECPMVKLYVGRLREIADRFGGDGVQVIGIDSNRQDSVEDVSRYIDEQQVRFPILRDDGNIIADDFGAARTPEVFLVDSKLNVIYRGCIDDQYSPGVSRSKADREHLIVAIGEWLSGKPVEIPQVEATGCMIGRVTEVRADATVTFSNQVSRVFHKHCVECHRPDEIGPFSLTDFDEASGWGETIVEVIDNGRMPPWHATDGLAPLENTRHMPDADKQLVRDWVVAGMPKGDVAELPTLPEFPTGWRLPREPDVVFEMAEKPFEVPADGVVEYQYFVVDPDFREDVWIATAEVAPGNRRVVHHSIVFVRPPESRGMWGIGWLGAYVPGQSAPKLLPGHATFVPAGSKLVFQQHYTPTGRVESDTTKIGIVFAKAGEVTHHVYTLASLDQEFEINPGESAHAVKSRLENFSPNAKLLAVSPHMHYRGKSYRLSRTNPDGTSQLLVDVPGYDFNWQHSYQFAEPVLLREVQSLSSEFVFDNSPANPFNPDPKEYVTWGDQTWEEMAVSFLTVSEPLNAVRQENAQVAVELQTGHEKRLLETRKYAETKADEMMSQLDRNGDGVIWRNEAPNSFSHFVFNWYDADKNGSITREECVEFLANHWDGWQGR